MSYSFIANAQSTSSKLPLEVLGAGLPNQPTIKNIELSIENSKLSQVNKIFISCHRCGFYAAPEFEKVIQPVTKIKASMHVVGEDNISNNNTAWVNITDNNFTLLDDADVHGGINGGYYTINMELTLDNATKARLVAFPKVNKLQFRFNGTDGESNGFRILNIQLRDINGNNLNKNNLAYDNVYAEKTAILNANDVSKGQILWYKENKILKSVIANRVISASCNSCHAESGRDLQYFNYSNNSIIQRSKFHGLTEQEGAQIAAYIRSANKNVAYVAQATPWNPPYQPNTGLGCDATTCRPVAQWAAGGGIEAVQKKAIDSLKYLVHQSPYYNSFSQSNIDNVMDINKTQNVVNTPTGLQFPDWNAWLPSMHPLDIWPQNVNRFSFVNGGEATGGHKNALQGYIDTKNWLEANKNPNGKYGDWSHLTADKRIEGQFKFLMLGWSSYQFLGGGRGNHIDNDSAAENAARYLQSLKDESSTSAYPASYTGYESFIERAAAGLMHWQIVKQWELVQKYGLEDAQKAFIGEKVNNTWVGRGEPRGWPLNTASLFFVAPHMMYQDGLNADGSKREWYFAWEENNKIASWYRTNQWYQLQMAVNAGAQSGFTNFPMDWPYLTGFDELIIQELVNKNNPKNANAINNHLVRTLQGYIKLSQYVNNNIPVNQPDPSDPTDIWKNNGHYGRAIAMKHFVPSNFMDQRAPYGNGSPTYYKLLDTIYPNLYKMFLNGDIKIFNQLYTGIDVNAWRRCDLNANLFGVPEIYVGFSFCLDPARIPLFINNNNLPYLKGGGLNSIYQRNAYGIQMAREMGGIEPSRLNTWSNWADRAWPSN